MNPESLKVAHRTFFFVEDQIFNISLCLSIVSKEKRLQALTKGEDCATKMWYCLCWVYDTNNYSMYQYGQSDGYSSQVCTRAERGGVTYRYVRTMSRAVQ